MRTDFVPHSSLMRNDPHSRSRPSFGAASRPHELRWRHDPHATTGLLREMAQVPRHERNPFDESTLGEGGIVRVREFHHVVRPNIRPGRARSNRGKHLLHVRWSQPEGGADQDLGVFREDSFVYDREDRTGA